MPLSMVPRRSTLTLGLLAGVSAASTGAIFIRFAQHEGAPSIVIATARLTIASLILAPLALTRYRFALSRLNRREWVLSLLSGIFLALHFATWITSLEYTSVTSSVVLVTTTPLWVALLAPLVLRERLGKPALIGLILALIGGVIVGLSDGWPWQVGAPSRMTLRTFFSGTVFLGNFLALAGAWMAAGYTLAGRKLRMNMELIPYIFVVYGIAAMTLMGIMLWMGESLIGLPAIVYPWFILLAVVPQLFGHSVFNWALKYLPASLVSVALLGEPVGSTILAYFIFQEHPGWVKIAGAMSILAGIWLVARGDKKQ